MSNVPLEVWKDIDGFEGLYQVSSYGRAKSLDRYVKHSKGGKRFVKGQILNATVSQYGYYMLLLSKNGKRKRFSIHRIVSIAFISNPFNKRTVNHINGIKTDNRVENLEWATYQENQRHAWEMGFYDNLINKRKKKIVMLALDNKPLLKFDSMTDANRTTNIQISNICKCCKGIRPTAGGYKWQFYQEGVV